MGPTFTIRDPCLLALVACMVFICLICCLLIVSVDPDIGDKTTCLFGNEIFLKRMTNHLEIKNSLSWKVLEPWRKVRNSQELFFHAKRSFEWVLESPRRVEKLVEYSRIGFVLYLAYDIVVS